MPEALQSLIDKLQGEVVQEADAKAGEILAEADAEAKRRLDAADAEARRIRTEAERDAKNARTRGEAALEQAGRDLLLSVRQALEASVMALVRHQVSEALTPETIRDMLLEMTRAHAGGATVLLSEADRKALAGKAAGALRAELEGGLELGPSDEITRGFRIVVRGEDLEHDFTLEAIAAVLGEMLRPELARILAGAETGAETDAAGSDAA